MAQFEEQNPLDYRAGGDTVDDAVQKYMKEMLRIYQFLNNIREHNSNGPNQVEPQPYIFKVTDNKLYIRNGANNAWLYLFDITYRMGMSDNPDAVILTSDDVTTTAEALKLVKTNSDGDIDADITGNAYKFGNKTADQYVTVDDVSDAGAALKIVKTDSNGVAHVSISGSAAQLNGKAASYYLNEDDLATVPSGATVTTDANKLVKTNANGVLPVNITGNAAKIAGINNEINNLQDGQVLTYRVASNSWRNEDKGVVGSGKALAIYDGSTLLDEYSGDAPKSIDLANTAINSRIDLVNGIAGREVPVSVGDTAMLEGIPAGYFLECTTAGTTGATAPVITTVTEGQTITDGTVVWTARKCFPTSAGALIAPYIRRNVDNSFLMLYGGTGLDAGATLDLRGKDNDGSDHAGGFVLRATDGNGNTWDLKGKTNGDLLWKGRMVFTSNEIHMVGTEIRRNADDSTFNIVGGTSSAYSPYLTLFGKDAGSGNGGKFTLFAQDGNNSIGLDGRPDGTLLWGNNDLAKASVVASSIGQNGYFKNNDGMIIAWSNATGKTYSATTPNTVTFPITFTSAPRVIVSVNSADGATAYVTNVTATGFSLWSSVNNTSVYYIAIGK